MLLPEDARGDVRWRLALLGMDLLLTGLHPAVASPDVIVRSYEESSYALKEVA